ncbi:tripartite tricarboxylate transporter substrate binding protein [Halovulum dunhuangense]|uniref:Tripartite tricarboxylate transporter substrate binding protein n=1 Tax=Halovulum dunhuangense TaxID=1505036 RepID=A0A849L1N8_9RHOB|nr:tripartite tricarboxylate transporter substrate binding protein [Halovulum dunhuangense]NNU80180.1 tripartite tricarboxylate transporter substrate binding protein [Halovulum dunhuangense]
MLPKIRTIAAGFAMAAAVGGLSLPAVAQDYPHDTVVLTTHSSPGGGTDVFLREMTRYLGKYLGVNFAVENVRGGSGAAAMADIATSPADGSRFYGTTPTYINTSLLSAPEYDFRDMSGVANVFLDPQIVFVRAESPFTNLAEVVEASKASPTAVKFGVTTPGSLDRQVMEQFKQLTGAQGPVITHDGGGELLISVLNGTVDLGIGEIQELSTQIEAGEIRLITTYTKERLSDFPDVPTASEQGIDLVVNKFRGIAGPKDMPEEIYAAWEKAIQEVLEDAEFKAWYEAQSLVPAFMGHEEYDAFLEEFATEQEAFLKEYGIIQ